MKLSLLACALFALASARQEQEASKGLRAQLSDIYNNLFDKIPGAGEIKTKLGQCKGDLACLEQIMNEQKSRMGLGEHFELPPEVQGFSEKLKFIMDALKGCGSDRECQRVVREGARHELGGGITELLSNMGLDEVAHDLGLKDLLKRFIPNQEL